MISWCKITDSAWSLFWPEQESGGFRKAECSTKSNLIRVNIDDHSLAKNKALLGSTTTRGSRVSGSKGRPETILHKPILRGRMHRILSSQPVVIMTLTKHQIPNPKVSARRPTHLKDCVFHDNVQTSPVPEAYYPTP